MEIIHYIQIHWFQISVDAVAAMNVIAAGARAMGWNKISDELGRLEEAITAMVQAAMSTYKSTYSKSGQTKQGGQISINFLLAISIIFMIGCSVKYSSHNKIVGTNLVTPYGTGNLNLERNSNLEMKK